MIRKARITDAEEIAETYEELLRYEEENGSHSNWQLGVYPTIRVPLGTIPQGTMYVLEERGEICASMVLNQEQADEYKSVPWAFSRQGPKENDVLVIHTLCVPPSKSGHGYGRQMVEYAKQYAKEAGYPAIRIDTYAHNEPAKRLYLRNGFRIAGYGQIFLQGLIHEDQVYLEYEVTE